LIAAELSPAAWAAFGDLGPSRKCPVFLFNLVGPNFLIRNCSCFLLWLRAETSAQTAGLRYKPAGQKCPLSFFVRSLKKEE